MTIFQLNEMKFMEKPISLYLHQLNFSPHAKQCDSVDVLVQWIEEPKIKGVKNGTAVKLQFNNSMTFGVFVVFRDFPLFAITHKTVCWLTAPNRLTYLNATFK